jgi:3-phosphoshikimate 1-carboxyvinyltransferase
VAALTVAGEVRAPGDKSISHRALMLAAVSTGRSRITGILDAADVRSTASVLRQLGVGIPALSPELVIDGVGTRGLLSPHDSLDCGNSGTTARLMAGVVAGAGVTARFVGDTSLSRRPMRRVARPLQAMGATIEFEGSDGLPMTIRGTRLRSIEWVSEIASAQVKSAVLLAGALAGVEVAVRERGASRDHTERMLAAHGVVVEAARGFARLHPTTRLDACDVDVPADPSSAAFFGGLAALAATGEIVLRDVCVNPTRVGFFHALRRMGPFVELVDARERSGEPVADILVRAEPLRAIAVGADEVPSLIDEIPLLACLAARARGDSRITGAAELRVKESDRVAAVVANLRAVGAEAHELPDGMVVIGSDKPLAGHVITHGDHRLAMAFAVLGAGTGGRISIDDRACVDVSYPDFWRDLERVSGASGALPQTQRRAVRG